jgi:hypothetical protein
MINSKYLWSYDDMGTPIEDSDGLCAHNDYLSEDKNSPDQFDVKKAVTNDNHSLKPKPKPIN